MERYHKFMSFFSYFTGFIAVVAVLVDDKKVNIDAARKLGMNAIWYKNPKQLKRELKKLI